MTGPPKILERSPIGGSNAKIGLTTLLKLRWGAVGCQLAAIIVAHQVLDLELPLLLLLVLIGTTALSNLVLTGWAKRGRELLVHGLGAVLIFDTLILTALLFESGGSANPFSVLYLVHVTLAAVILGQRWTWTITILSTACYGLLFQTLGPDGHAEHGYAGHLQGMWIAFSFAACLIAYFVDRLSRALAAREIELASLREQALKAERLVALTALAAGAAHELNTPLSTVAVVAKEIERKVMALDAPVAEILAEDARLIRSELERCRGILEDMSARSGEHVGEAVDRMDLGSLAADLTQAIGELAIRLRIEIADPGRVISVHRRALIRVLVNLVRNAADASPAHAAIDLKAWVERGTVQFAVRDQGSGMTEDVRERAIEPFFTTKPPGKGLGLGLFLAHSFVDRVGGTLSIRTAPERGTTVELVLPCGSRSEMGS